MNINWIKVEDGALIADFEAPGDGRVHVSIEEGWKDNFFVVTSTWEGTHVQHGFKSRAAAIASVESAWT